jgi:hypothetical protein
MSIGRTVVTAWILASTIAPASHGQSTGGVILGRVFDEVTGRPIHPATISAYHIATGARASSSVDVGGRYAIVSLPPGIYTVRADAPGYRPRETTLIELAVAGRTELAFPLRLMASDTRNAPYSESFVPGVGWVHTYTADVQATQAELLTVLSGTPVGVEATLSYVVSPAEVDSLPLSGRDLYNTLALQPGVTAYAGTARGLGLSVTGQRPSSTNFLLDGLDNNNHLTTGPLTTITPEAMLEYRISTHNYSAEYGQTSGLVANAVSRQGTNGWHGQLYSYFKHELLSANAWQNNAAGIGRPPLREAESGAAVTGGLSSNMAASLSFDAYRYASRNDPVDWLLPTREWIASTSSQTAGGRLLRQYAAPVAPSAPGDVFASYGIAPTVTISRDSATPRLDYVTSGDRREHVTVRLAMSHLRQPDLIYSPYPGFSAPFRQNADGLALVLSSNPRARLTNELRASLGGDSTRLDRVHDEVPFFETGDGATLPGSPAALKFHYGGRQLEASDTLSLVAGRSIFRFGGGLLWRGVDSLEAPRADGLYVYDNLARFAADEPKELFLEYDRSRPGNLSAPTFSASYRYGQWFGFAQHSYKASRRLFFDYGFRYEFYGAPRIAGGGQAYEVNLGAGADLRQRLASAQWGLNSGRLYSSVQGNAGLRFGSAYDLTGDGETVLKSGYGWFFDRPYDNLWQGLQANRWQFGISNFANQDPTDHTPVAVLTPPYSVAARQPPDVFSDPEPPVLYQPGIRSPRVQSFFAAIQRRAPGIGAVELAYAGSISSALTTTDLVNRPYSTQPDAAANLLGLINSGLPLLAYRANQGKASYHALSATLRLDTRRVRGQVAYTWSHSIDLESDPLAGGFFSFNLFNAQRASDKSVASFTRQFDSQGDRASSDFDQRHNLVFYGVAAIPAVTGRAERVLRDWQVAWMGAIRSGFPYTVFGDPAQYIQYGIEVLYNNPADQVQSGAPSRSGVPPGGKQLLSESEFVTPPAGQVGDSGRNRFRGPGLMSLDLSLARTFHVPRWERGQITVRADAYNVLNHANLNNPPITTLHEPGFGVGFYGRQETNSGFPLLVPFNEAARIVQVMFRVSF